MKSNVERIKRGPFRFHHDAWSPFPVRARNGKFIVDEKCRCGARRSEHMDTLAYGHGACPPVSCDRFTWVAFIYAGKFQQQKLEQEARP